MVRDNEEVMIVEDEDESRTLLIRLLELEGFRAVGCANGAEALAHLAHSPLPCLVIMDIRMPVMDGPQFRAAMLADPRLAKIPVIVVTAFEPPSANNLFALRVFRKPVDVEALLGTVKENC